MNRIMLFVMILTSIVGSSFARTQNGAAKAASKEEMRAAIKDVLAATFEQGARRKPDGSLDHIELEFMHVKDESRKRVRDFGDPAVSILREYVKDYEGWRQQVVLELLGEFRSDESLVALVDFAEHSKVRYIAVSQMAQYPIDKTRPILKKFLSDPDPIVRDTAKRALASYGEK